MAEADILFMLNCIILALLVVSAIAVVCARQLLVSVVLMGVFSLLMSASYLILGAPDVAITEAAIGAGISTVLLLAVMLITRDDHKPPRHRLIALIMVVLTGAFLIYATQSLPLFGDPNAVTNLHVAPYYLEQSYGDMHIPNVVTSILAGYRSYDTMGETFVVFTALIAVLLLLRTHHKDKA